MCKLQDNFCWTKTILHNTFQSGTQKIPRKLKKCWLHSRIEDIHKNRVWSSVEQTYSLSTFHGKYFPLLLNFSWCFLYTFWKGLCMCWVKYGCHVAFPTNYKYRTAELWKNKAGWKRSSRSLESDCSAFASIQQEKIKTEFFTRVLCGLLLYPFLHRQHARLASNKFQLKPEIPISAHTRHSVSNGVYTELLWIS